jgi:DNA-binding GntR family transcriptional regulator
MQELSLPSLGHSMQLSDRVHQLLRDQIVTGAIEPGARLRVEALAQQLGISSTPIRDALNRLEKDGLISKNPYQGAVVRVFDESEIHDLYELRAGLECIAVRLACLRITEDEVAWLRQHQKVGQTALAEGDMEVYRVYNQDYHSAILKAARNAQLTSVMEGVLLQFHMLTAQTIRVAGRPERAIQEHAQIIDFIEQRKTVEAVKLMEHHVISALHDLPSRLKQPNATVDSAL